MNWVGGARTRVKTKDSKKKQQEFFEKKRFENKLVTSKKIESNENKNEQLSQDLVFLRTLMTENPNKAKKAAPPVVHINFEKPRSSNCSFLSRHNVVELSESPVIKISQNKKTPPDYSHENVLKPQLELNESRHLAMEFLIPSKITSSDCDRMVHGGRSQTVLFEHIYDSFSLTHNKPPLYSKTEKVQFLEDDSVQTFKIRYSEWDKEEGTEIKEDSEEIIENQSESLSSSEYDNSPQTSSEYINLQALQLRYEDDGSPKNKMPRLERSSSFKHKKLFRKSVRVADVETQTEIVQTCDVMTQT